MLLEIAPVNDAGLLPACTPSLMPFCISYTGPAPTSRYFRPRPAPPSLTALALDSQRSSSSATLVEQVTAVPLATDTVADMDSETQPALDAVPLDNSSRFASAHTVASRNVERFVAAFRGRQMYGHAVDIPNGYGGLVLRAPLDSKGKGKEDATLASKPLSQKSKPKSRTRAATRRSKRTTRNDTADEPEDGDCCPDSAIDPPSPARKLVPSSTFTSFMLWAPDRPLDEGRDEYVRALVEWTRLATEVGSFQCLHSSSFL
ncbi:hypothetical protein OG21DRAFT_1410192 [Imleria badia]|nr:hypothetical protein OG21DRAFT_1410192 [Imleria badia]